MKKHFNYYSKSPFSSLLFMGVVVLLVSSTLLSGCAPKPVPSEQTVAPKVTQVIPTTPAKPAWQEKWDKTLTDARKEGKVIIYGEVLTELRAKLDKGIKDRLGLETEYLSGKSAELSTRYLKEREAGLASADILLMGCTTALTLIKPKGVLTSPEPYFILPEVLDTRAWPNNRLPFVDKDKTVIPIIAAYRNWIAVNTKLVKEGELTSYQDLLHPRWKGKIVIYDPTISGAGSTWFNFMIKILGTEEGKKYMQKLAQQEPFFTRDSRLQVEWLAKEKYPVAIAILPQVLIDFVKVGAPIEYVKVKEGGIVVHGAGGVELPDRRPNPNASIVVLNWLLTEEGQTAYSQGFGEPAMRLGVTTADINPGTIIPPGEKPMWVDEEFLISEPKIREMSQEVFAHLLK